MNTASFDLFMEQQKQKVDRALLEEVDRIKAPQVLKDAMSYSLKAGGKRIRPLLVFAVLDAFGKELEYGMKAACAIEMIHTYSLIHDDLPSMDNDVMRRGKPTNHIVYGEATAILAGDALLTHSFTLLTENMPKGITAEQKLELVSVISSCAGAGGMVGGQTADMEAEGKAISLAELEYIHEHKTGRLLSASVLAGAILAGATKEEKAALKDFSHHLGLAFQIRDDILDIEGSEEEIGKPVGSDVANHKNTYPALLTLDGAKAKLQEEISVALSVLKELNMERGFLYDITKLVAFRTK
ncbi:polyprenyl synthetase family protein [Bacillus testis]|uniref:polyprenyl synthetase family protein n=1 Tax=Bacillus testis TaxID=1622072 RepID=UPI00067EE337|nr:farnesyl diphosphate synthase [Bacillus testis]